MINAYNSDFEFVFSNGKAKVSTVLFEAEMLPVRPQDPSSEIGKRISVLGYA